MSTAMTRIDAKFADLAAKGQKAFVTYVMAGDPDSLYLLASDAGYGFIARLGDTVARTKAGKSVLSVPKNAE